MCKFRLSRNLIKLMIRVTLVKVKVIELFLYKFNFCKLVLVRMFNKRFVPSGKYIQCFGVNLRGVQFNLFSTFIFSF